MPSAAAVEQQDKGRWERPQKVIALGGVGARALLLNAFFINNELLVTPRQAQQVCAYMLRALCVASGSRGDKDEDVVLPSPGSEHNTVVKTIYGSLFAVDAVCVASDSGGWSDAFMRNFSEWECENRFLSSKIPSLREKSRYICYRFTGMLRQSEKLSTSFIHSPSDSASTSTQHKHPR